MKGVTKDMNQSYIRPLFWQHGEPGEVLAEEMQRMRESGIDSFILESRPHPDFLGYGWWRDLDFIIAEAKRTGMKVWIFDDSAYPSGYGSGRLKSLYPETLKRYVKECHIDARGPLKGSSFLVKEWLEEEDVLLSAVAAKRKGFYEDLEDGSFVDITDRIQDGILYWDVPDGAWRVFFLINTRNGGEEWTKNYVNPLDGSAVDKYIEIVYEEHYKRYSGEFGNVIQGFFTDEPRFGNASSYSARPGDWSEHEGVPASVYPYSGTLIERVSAELGEDFGILLPYLWCGRSDRAKDIRYQYMDVVSKLFGTEFLGRMGNWCRAHGVALIGHVVEDNGAHARLGYGCGHFFRAMEGMDTSGLDVVYQIWPEYTEGRHKTPFGYLDSRFYYWGLPKMASSLAHLDPKKKGITVCEIFGAYGWQEGLKLMKWLTDHVCVRGVNLLIPHAFSPKFPDPDCPPHFYARGNNPQWEYFHLWSAYANRVCGLLTGGKHIAPAAVLYHAEAEWGGEYEPFECVVKTLAERQTDCDVVSADYLAPEKASVSEKKLVINGEEYCALIIPYAQALPESTADALLRLSSEGVPVIFMNGYPERIYLKPVCDKLEMLQNDESVQTMNYEELAAYFADPQRADITANPSPACLSAVHVRKEDGDIYFFVNESRYETVSTAVSLKRYESILCYDAMQNRVYRKQYASNGGRTEFLLELAPYQSVFVLGAEKLEEALELLNGTLRQVDGTEAAQTSGVSAADSGQAAVFTTSAASAISAAPAFPAVLTGPAQEIADGYRIYIEGRPDLNERLAGLTKPANLAIPEYAPKYSGKIWYETAFEYAGAGKQTEADEAKSIAEKPKEDRGNRTWLDLGDVYEIAEVFVNGEPAGARICPPYRFDVTNLVNDGRNELKIAVVNTFAKERGNNIFDRAMAQEPTGLIGPVKLVVE